MIKKEMIAMLLAGGQGSRLGVLTSKVAKPAVAFGGKDRIIEYFKSNIIYALVTFVISIVTGLICYSVGLDGINGLIIKSIICVIIPNIMYILIYCKTKKFKEAKKFIISIVSKEGVVKWK